MDCESAALAEEVVNGAAIPLVSLEVRCGGPALSKERIHSWGKSCKRELILLSIRQ